MKSMLIERIVAVGLFAFTTFGGAAAQESADLAARAAAFDARFATGEARVFDRIGREAMTAYFAGDGYRVVVEREDENAIVLREDTDGGGAFYAALLGCEAGQCNVVELFAYFNPQGVTLNAVNQAHSNMVAGSTIILQPDDAIIARRVVLQGGVTFQNLAAEVGLFLADADLFLASLSPGGATGVSFPVAPVSRGSKIDGLSHGASAASAPIGARFVERPLVNAVGANAPRLGAPGRD